MKKFKFFVDGIKYQTEKQFLTRKFDTLKSKKKLKIFDGVRSELFFFVKFNSYICI